MATRSYVRLRARLGVKVCHLRPLWLPARVLRPYGRGGEWQAAHLPSPSLSTQASKHTLCCTRQPGAHTRPVRYLTLTALIPCRQSKRASGQTPQLLHKEEQDGWGFCVLCSRDWLSAVGPSHSSRSNKPFTEETTLCHVRVYEFTGSWTQLRRRWPSTDRSYTGRSSDVYDMKSIYYIYIYLSNTVGWQHPHRRFNVLWNCTFLHSKDINIIRRKRGKRYLATAMNMLLSQALSHRVM